MKKVMNFLRKKKAAGATFNEIVKGVKMTDGDVRERLGQPLNLGRIVMYRKDPMQSQRWGVFGGEVVIGYRLPEFVNA